MATVTESAGATAPVEAADDLLKLLQREHGPVAVVKPKRGPVLYFKPLTVEAADRWVTKVSSGNDSKTAATRESVLSLLVHPSRKEAEAVFEQFPAMPPSINNKQRRDAGDSATVDVQVDGDREIAVVVTDYGTLKCQCPTQIDHEAWLQRCSDDKGEKPAFTREYILSSLADGMSEVVAKTVLEKLPTLHEPVAKALAIMAGAEISYEVKKA
jgi:hypothetical protein